MTNYRCLIYGEGFAEGGTPGTLTVLGDSVVARAGDNEFSLPSQGLNLRQAGATGDQVLITHGAYPGITIALSDTAAIADLKRLTGGAGLSARRVGRRSACCLAGCLLTLGIVIAGIIGIFSLREPAIRWVSSKVPVAWEEKLGSSVMAQMKVTAKINQDPAALADLEALAKPIVDTVADKRYKFIFHLATDEQVNAFTLPGGFVVVNSGLILKADRAEEVLGVIAHEIAHVTERHSTQQLVNRAGIAILLQLAVGDAGALAVLAEGGAYLMNMSYSRTHEQEADDVGAANMIRAKIDPSGMIDFFKKLRSEEEETGTAKTRDALTFLGTHPGTLERVERLNKKIGTVTFPPNPDLDQTFERLKQRLQKPPNSPPN